MHDRAKINIRRLRHVNNAFDLEIFFFLFENFKNRLNCEKSWNRRRAVDVYFLSTTRRVSSFRHSFLLLAMWGNQPAIMFFLSSLLSHRQRAKQKQNRYGLPRGDAASECRLSERSNQGRCISSEATWSAAAALRGQQRRNGGGAGGWPSKTKARGNDTRSGVS